MKKNNNEMWQELKDEIKNLKHIMGNYEKRLDTFSEQYTDSNYAKNLMFILKFDHLKLYSKKLIKELLSTEIKKLRKENNSCSISYTNLLEDYRSVNYSTNYFTGYPLSYDSGLFGQSLYGLSCSRSSLIVLNPATIEKQEQKEPSQPKKEETILGVLEHPENYSVADIANVVEFIKKTIEKDNIVRENLNEQNTIKKSNAKHKKIGEK